MAELRWGAATDTGRVRTENEDNLFSGPTLFVVADGMGGHQAGEIASQLTVDRLQAGLADEKLTISDLVNAIGQANRDIFDASINNAEQHGMGTTVTSLAVMDDPEEGEVFALANVGDSRTYLLRHDRLRQLTIDHSYVQELVAEGHISRDEARNHPRRNIVTRALGIEPTIRIDSWTLPIVRGDRFLLCSDGLVDEVHDDDITRVLVEHDEPQAAADELVRLALQNGGRDNVTVIVIDVLDGRDPPDPTEELDLAPAWADDLGDTGPVDPITPGVGRPGVLADPDDPSDTNGTSDTTDATEQGSSGIDAPDLDPSERAVDAPLVIEPDAVGDPPPPPVATAEATPGFGTDPSPTQPEPDQPGTAPSGGRRRLVRFVSLVTVAAVAVVTLTLVGAWARSGFFVAFDDDTVVVYRGRAGGALWFDPTVEFRTSITRDDLDPALVGIVESQRRFESLRSAEIFVTDRLGPATTTTTTTTTTTPPTTTLAPTTTTIDEAGDAGS